MVAVNTGACQLLLLVLKLSPVNFRLFRKLTAACTPDCISRGIARYASHGFKYAVFVGIDFRGRPENRIHNQCCTNEKQSCDDYFSVHASPFSTPTVELRLDLISH